MALIYLKQDNALVQMNKLGEFLICGQVAFFFFSRHLRSFAGLNNWIAKHFGPHVNLNRCFY